MSAGPGDAISREFVALESPTARVAGHGSHPCQGLYWRPAGARPRVAMIATHYNVDFSEHYLAPLMARRGIGFLGWNTRYRGAEDLFLLEHALIDIGVGVDWLRRVAGVDRVLLLGNSGGGSLMAAYESQAREPSVKPLGGRPAPDALLSLSPADLYVSLNAHPGRPEVYTAWLDPAVTDERDPTLTRRELDMYDTANGPPYSEEFVARYRAAQVERNRSITRWVLAELPRLASRGYRDRVFPVHRAWADLRFMDPALDPSHRKPRWCYAGDPAAANRGPLGLGRSCTLPSWLSMWSLEHSQCRGSLHLGKLTIPALVVQSLADSGVFPSDARAIYDALGAKDKQLEWLEGAHYFEEPAGARETVADAIAGWVAERG